jgi:hypothetical protein
MSRWQSLVVLLFLAMSLATHLPAEETAADAERAKHLKQMRKVASSIQVLADPKSSDSAVKLKEEPVLRYADSTRQTQESSLWIWSGGGRPTAILAVEYYPQGPAGPRWLYEIASLSNEPIAASCDEIFQWIAKEPGLKLQTLTAAPLPAEKEARRLGQMKELQRRFTAYENATGSGRIELRPLVTPLLRYSDAKQGLIDGAILSFASGTNPEVFLVLEANVVKEKSEWQYALVQMTGEPVSVQLDGKEIWKQEGANPPTVRANYINGWIAAKKDE